MPAATSRSRPVSQGGGGFGAASGSAAAMRASSSFTIAAFLRPGPLISCACKGSLSNPRIGRVVAKRAQRPGSRPVDREIGDGHSFRDQTGRNAGAVCTLAVLEAYFSPVTAKSLSCYPHVAGRNKDPPKLVRCPGPRRAPPPRQLRPSLHRAHGRTDGGSKPQSLLLDGQQRMTIVYRMRATSARSKLLSICNRRPKKQNPFIRAVIPGDKSLAYRSWGSQL